MRLQDKETATYMNSYLKMIGIRVKKLSEVTYIFPTVVKKRKMITIWSMKLKNTKSIQYAPLQIY